MTETTDSSISPLLSTPARLISWIFSPLLIPSYGVWLALWGSTLAWLPARIRWHAVLYTFILTCAIPLAFISLMRLFKVVKSIALRDRADRGIPYMAAMACYITCAMHFFTSHAPMWFCMYFIGAAVSIVLVCAINLKWKISAHATAAGGLVAITLQLTLMNTCVIDMTGPLTAVIILAGMSGTSRLLLERHTPAQVWAGYINGAVCVFCSTLIN